MMRVVLNYLVITIYQGLDHAVHKLIPFHWIRLELAGNVPCANADPSPLPFPLSRSITFVPRQVDAPINQTKCHF